MSDTNPEEALAVPKPSIMPDTPTDAPTDKKNGDVEQKKTPVKRKSPTKKVAKKEDNDEADEPTTPKVVKKRTPKAKKEKEVNTEVKSDIVDEDVDMDEAVVPATPPAAPSSKKRATKAKDDGDDDATPTKKRKTKATKGDADTPAKAPKTPKAKATATSKTKFPECIEDFSEGDKLLVHMRKAGKSWEEVEAAWTAVTGSIPGKDVLRKKEAKLRAVAIEWKAGDARKLVAFKAQVEEESAAAFKKLEADKWNRMVGMFRALGSEYPTAGLQKKWEVMQKKGEVDAKGVYVGEDPEVSDGPAEDSETLGAAKVEENEEAEEELEVDGDADAEV